MTMPRFGRLSGNRSFIARRSMPATNYTESTNIANILTEHWRLTVPNSTVLQIDPTLPFLLFAAFSETIASGGTGATAFETTHAPARILLGHDSHSDGEFQEVVEDSDGDAPLAITAVADHIDGGTASVTATALADEDHRVSYVPFVDGEVQVRLESPRLGGKLSRTIFQDDLKHLFGINQWKWNRLDAPCFLPPKYSLVVYIKSAVVFNFSNGATTQATDLANIARVQVPVVTYPHRQFWLNGEAPGKKGKALDDWVDSILAQIG